jgi:AcrR family transcriptional regulator
LPADGEALAVTVEQGAAPPGRMPRDVREEILQATQRLIQERGLAGTTTKAIAEQARCAEGSIYRYFPDKHALFVECVKLRYPDFVRMMDSLPDLAGTGSARHHLEEVTKAALAFYRAILPMVAGAMAEYDLLLQQRAFFGQSRSGPRKLIAALAEYVRREQRLGRLSDRASADYVSRTILGACWFHAYLESYLGEEAPARSDGQFARETIRCLMEPLTKVPNKPMDGTLDA